MSGMFSYCYSLTAVPLFNTASVTNMSGMFSYCYSLTAVPLFNTAAVTNMSGMFQNCYSLAAVPAIDMSAITSDANQASMFINCNSLMQMRATGIKWNLDLTNASLSAAELDIIYGNLATVAKTITVTGNYGVAGDTPSIATAKGWTVTG
jgi:surface protein